MMDTLRSTSRCLSDNHESTKARKHESPFRSFRVFGFSCLILVVLTPSAFAQQPQPGHTLTLAEALEIAEKKSEAIGIARAGVGRAEGERRRAKSAL